MEDLESILKREASLSSREVEPLITVSGMHNRISTLENSKYGTRIFALRKEIEERIKGVESSILEIKDSFSVLIKTIISGCLIILLAIFSLGL